MALAAALTALFAAPAQASPTTIAGFGEGAGRVKYPVSVAVDQSSGELYVADHNNFRVLKFNREGDFLLGWGRGVADGVSAELQTCGPEASPPTARCFGTVASTIPGAVSPQAVAVDQGTGDVYVADSGANRRVTKFSPAGQLRYILGRNVNETKASEEGAGAPYTQAEKDICSAADLEAGDECGEGKAGTGPGEFDRPRSLALDPEGKLWIGDTERLQRLEPDGSFDSEVQLPGAGETTSLAIGPGGDFYLKSASLPGIRRLHPDGTPYGAPYPLDAAGNPLAVTLDATGKVYVGECGIAGDICPAYRFMVFSPGGALVTQFGAGQVLGAPGATSGFNGTNALAVDEGAGRLYVASSGSSDENSAVQAFELPAEGPLPEGQKAAEVLPGSATLEATLSPEGYETTYRFEYDTAPYEAGEAGHGTAIPVPDATLEEGGAPYEGFEELPVQAHLEGLVPDTTYHFRLVATNHCKPAEPAVQCTVAGPDTSFATRPAVAIEAQWASDLSAHDTTLNARLDPLGAEGRWWVEYDSAPYQQGQPGHGTSLPLPHGSLSASSGEVPVAVPVGGLQAATTYHYRFVAEDEREVREGGETLVRPFTAYGDDHRFTTQPAALGFSLPDGRAWEMVSPPDKHGGRIGPFDSATGGQLQAAADGEALAYLSFGSLEARPEGNRAVEQSSQLSRRGAGGTWSTRDLTAPHTAVTQASIGKGLEYKLFGPNLASALMEPRDPTLLSPYATECTPYVRTDAEPPAYEPLVSGAPGYADVPPGTEFGTSPFAGPKASYGAVKAQAATPDLRHVVLSSEVPLAAGAVKGSLYECMSGLRTCRPKRACGR